MPTYIPQDFLKRPCKSWLHHLNSLDSVNELMMLQPEFFLLRANEAHVDDLWAGESVGKQILAKLVGLVPKLDQDFVVVNLDGVSMITASAFRASLRGLREYIGGTFHKATVFANAAAETLEEAEFVASKYGDVYLFADLKASKLHNMRLVGELDPTLLDTLELLALHGECDAKTLFDLRKKPGVTAWHNRLTDLAVRGLVTVRADGRSRKFRSLLQGVSHGHRVHSDNV